MVRKPCTIRRTQEGPWTSFDLEHTHLLAPSSDSDACTSYSLRVSSPSPSCPTPISRPTVSSIKHCTYRRQSPPSPTRAPRHDAAKDDFGNRPVWLRGFICGIAATGMQLGTHAEPLTICAGIGCGAGLSLSLVSWFETISSFQERKGALTFGWQAFLGSSVFAIVALLNKAFTNASRLGPVPQFRQSFPGSPRSAFAQMAT